ncbi:MAG: NAD-binding protein [Haliea sp.]
MQLCRAEASGFAKYEKMTPRIAQTARVLWLIYLSLTAACAVSYWAAGMAPSDRPYKRIVIAGGGNIGKRLAELLERDYRVEVIESSADRCRLLAKSLHHSIVLQGEAGEAALLEGEDIDSADVFCALTNDDETNVLSAMLAKRLGARKTMAITNRASYVDIVQGTALDIAISPAQVTIGALLAHIRRGDVVAVHSLRRGAAEAIEVVAHGDAYMSRAVGRGLRAAPAARRFRRRYRAAGASSVCRQGYCD